RPRRRSPAGRTGRRALPELLQHALDEAVDLLERAVVHEDVIRAVHLLIVRHEPAGAPGHVYLRPRRARLLRRRDDDDAVETGFGPGLEQQRDLGDADRRAVEPGHPDLVLAPYAWVEQRLQPRKLVRVGEDDLRDPGALGRAEALLERGANLRVARDQPVDDLVARLHRYAAAPERP